MDDWDDDYELNYILMNNTERREKEYFIDRKGKIYKYDGDLTETIISMHLEIACQILGRNNHRSPDDALLNMGWCLVGSTCYHNPYLTREPSQAQINTLDKLGLLKRLCIVVGGYHKNYLEEIKE